MSTKKIAIIGGGWAGISAAIVLANEEQKKKIEIEIEIFESAKQLGGRARNLIIKNSNNKEILVDNGQHILIGAYKESLKLFEIVGVNLEKDLLRIPLNLQDMNNQGIKFFNLPSPLDTLFGILSVKDWKLSDKINFFYQSLSWQFKNIDENLTVEDICQNLSKKIKNDLINPLCISALNLPINQASGKVFIQVLKDSFKEQKSSNFLIPKIPLGNLFPEKAQKFLETKNVKINLGQNIDKIFRNNNYWQIGKIENKNFDAIIIATSSKVAGDLTKEINPEWSSLANNLEFTAIATIYFEIKDFELKKPLISLEFNAENPAQFIFDRGFLENKNKGIFSAVISFCRDSKKDLEQKVFRQIVREFKNQPNFKEENLKILKTIIDKRATFTCLPNIKRPENKIASNFYACGDYINGPYPATLEGAINSGQNVSLKILENL